MALFSSSSLTREYFAKAEQFRGGAARSLQALSESTPMSQSFDIFISHSILDAEVIAGLKTFLERLNYTVYVDWVDDGDLDRSQASRDTAQRIKLRMERSRSLFYATSTSATASRWMPWECGYFDGLKQKVAICPISLEDTIASRSDSYQGREYLGLYPYVAPAASQGTGTTRLWVHESSKTYVEFSSWLRGEQPTNRP